MDKKEEVLDIKLTQYGKFLLSNGKFKPVYYAFFDDNILYDGEYGGVIEVQNDIDTRIREDSPQLQTQNKFTSKNAETVTVTVPDPSAATGYSKVVLTEVLASEALNKILGKSSLKNDYYPAYNLKMYAGEITGSVNTNYTSSFGKRITQIESTVKCKVRVKSFSDLPTTTQPTNASTVISQAAEDNTYLSVEADYILLELAEENVDFKMENFDLEVFQINNKGASNEELIPLTFNSQGPNLNIVNNILLDPVDDEYVLESAPGPSNVEYYFNIYGDSNIDGGILIKGTQQIQLVATDIYGTNIDSDDLCS